MVFQVGSLPKAPFIKTVSARRRRAWPRWLFSPFTMTLYALVLGLGLGLGSAYHALQGDYPFGRVAIGPWLAWPDAGSVEADPYARAILAKRGEIPLAQGEGVALRAETDSAGRPLDASCTYRIGNTVPQARSWTIAVYDGNGDAVTSDLQRSGFTSSEILRDDHDRFTITLSRDIQPGNWIRLPGQGSFGLSLRLYEIPGVAGIAKYAADALPSIERLECGS